MSKKRNTHYVVWAGFNPGIFTSWSDCKKQIEGYSGARYKGFSSWEAARLAWQEGAAGHWGKKKTPKTTIAAGIASGEIIGDALCVDAACNMTTRTMEYRGVWLKDGSVAFHRGVYSLATNNIGEFLALVHGLMWLKRWHSSAPLYSDSRTALAWYRAQRTRSVAIARGAVHPHLVTRVQWSERWLRDGRAQNVVLPWHSQRWGEIPADYGRK